MISINRLLWSAGILSLCSVAHGHDVQPAPKLDIAPQSAGPQASGGAPSSVTSPQSTAMPQGSLAEIIVTAEKHAEPIQNVPMSITALTGAALQNEGAETLADIGHLVPGLSVVSISPGENTIILNGISSTGGSEPTVGLYIDDTPVPSSGIGGGADPVLFDLDRIEVLRGPQGTLYGASSMGGTVRYITRQPNLTTFEGAAKATVSYTDGGGMNNEFDGMVNLPFSPTLALRATGVYRNYSGYIDSYPIDPHNILAALPGPVDKDVNTESTWAGRLVLEYKPFRSLVVAPMVMYQRILLGAPFEFDEPPGTFDHPIQTADTNQPIDNEFYLLSLPIHADLGPVQVVSTTSYYNSFFEAEEDESKVAYYYFSPPQTSVYPVPFWNSYKLEEFTEETRASATVGRIRGLVGLYYSHQNRPANFYMPISAGYNAAFGTPFGDMQFYTQTAGGRLNNSAVFSQIGVRLTDRLELTLGDRAFRVTQAQTNFGNGVFNGGPVPLTKVGSVEHGTTPKVGLSYHLTHDAMVYADAEEGFRPGAGETGLPVTCDADLRAIGLNGSPSAYASDSLWEYEVGEKVASQRLGLSVDSNIFYINWKKLQQTVALPACGFNFTGNFGTATSKGAVVQLQYDITRALRVDLGGSFTQAQLTSTVVGAQGAVGDPLENVPKWMGNVSFEYHTTIHADVAGFVRLDMNAVSRQYNNFVPTSIYYATAGYSLANIRFGLDTDQWQASVFVNNLGNKHAETALPTSYAVNLPDTRAVSLNRPLTIGFDVRRDF